MDCTQVLLTEPLNDINTVSERFPVATLAIGDEYHTIYNKENSIGRESGCDIVINNNAVSSKHAIIEAEDPDAHLIYDLGSTNKTKLGKIFLKPHVRYHINDGDYVTFGNVSAQYNISRQYPSSPVKGKSSLNSCSVPETPERPDPTQVLIVLGECKKELKVDNSTVDTSDSDMFDEKDVSSNDQKLILTSKTDNDIYELDTLTFDDNDSRETLVTVPCSNKSNISEVSDESPKLDPGKESDMKDVDNNKNSSKDQPNCDKEKMKDNDGWEDFPDIASPVGLDTSNADNLDCLKPKLSTSLLDSTNNDLAKSKETPQEMKCQGLSEKAESKLPDTENLSHKGNNMDTPENDVTIIEPKKMDFEKTPNTKNHPDVFLKPKEYADDDFNIIMSQNTDMFEDTPYRAKTDAPEQDVYEMLTQVYNENRDTDNLNDSVYDIQTQIVPSNESTPKIPRHLKKSEYDVMRQSDILEPATQPYDSKVDEEIGNVSLRLSKVIDESDQNCSFSSSMLEAATQPCPKPLLFPSSCDTKEESTKTVENSFVKTDDITEKDNTFSTSMFEVATQPCPPKANEKTEIPDEKSLTEYLLQNKNHLSTKRQDDKDLNCTFSTSLCQLATQPYANRSPDITEHTKLDKVGGKFQDESLSSSLFEAATQPHPQENIETHHSNKDLMEKTVVGSAGLSDLTSNRTGNDSFSASMYEAATQPLLLSTGEKRQTVEKGGLNKATEEEAVLLTGKDKVEGELSFSTSISEAATQPCAVHDRSLDEKVDPTTDIEMKKSEIEKIREKDNPLIHETINTPVFEAATQLCQYISENSSKQCEIILNSENIKGEEPQMTLDAADKFDISKEKCNLTLPESFFEAATQPVPIAPHRSSQNYIEEEKSKYDAYEKINKSQVLVNSEKIIPNKGHSNHKTELFTEIENHNTVIECGLTVGQSLQKVSGQFHGIAGKKEALSSDCFDKAKCSLIKNDGEKDDSFSVSREKKNSLGIVGVSNEILEETLADKTLVVDIDQEENTSPLIKVSKELDSSYSGIAKRKDSIKALNSTFSDGFFGAETQPLLNQGANLEKHVRSLAEQLQLISEEGKTAGSTIDSVSNEALNTSSKEPIHSNDDCSHKHNALSDSFFDAATQPYKDVNPDDKTFLDPLTSICDDLSVRKIAEITEELMCGNISSKLIDSSNLLPTNSNSKESRSSSCQNVDCVSDNNIYDALNNDPFCCSDTKVLSNKVDDDNIMEKLSTLDLKRILESDDLTHKYDEFQQIDVTSDKEEVSLKDLTNSNGAQNKEDSGISTLEKCNELINSKSKVVENTTLHDRIIKYSKKVENDDSSQELNIRSNKKRSNIYPPDSQIDDYKNLANDDSSQELNIRSNKKRSNIFPPDSQIDDMKVVQNDDSSQELNIRSSRKRCNLFPPDSQNDESQNFENNDISDKSTISNNEKHNFSLLKLKSCNTEISANVASTQESMIQSCKQVFPDESKAIDKKESTGDPQNESRVSPAKINEDNLISEKNACNDKNLTADEMDNQLSNNDAHITNIDNTIKNEENSQDNGLSDKCNKLNLNSRQVTKTSKGQPSEKHSNLIKKTAKESKNKSPSEREPTYISRGNITLHSPEVLSELEEQFRLTQVAMSPTQLSILSEEELDSSLEIMGSPPKNDVRRSVRNQKNVSFKSFKKISKNSQPVVSQKKTDSNSLILEENSSERSENKIIHTNSVTAVSKSEKSFKKFKKISPSKNSNPIEKNGEKSASVQNDDSKSLSVICNYSDNSQNSEELGRGKRKRIRPSYEGFILEEDKKRTPRKKLSFSQGGDDSNLNTSVVKLEDINKELLTESNNCLSNDLSVNIIQPGSVVSEVTKTKADSKVNELFKNELDENQVFQDKKTTCPSDKGENSKNLNKNKSNLKSMEDKATLQSKKAEVANKDNKNTSFSFTDKLDELFNIWGPADRVKLSPRVAKKSYKLLADGKIDSGGSWSSSSSSKKSEGNTNSNKELKKEEKLSKVDRNKNSKKSSSDKTHIPQLDVRINNSSANLNSGRKRSQLQKKESSTEFSQESPEISKKRKKNDSETSENSVEFDNNNDNSDPAIRKSTRISRKKNVEPSGKVPENKGEPLVARSTRSNRGKRGQLVESNLIAIPNNSKNSLVDKLQPAASLNPAINVNNKCMPSNDQKNKSILQSLPSTSTEDDAFCFSQEFSFHESKIEKENKLLSDNCMPPPLKIRRSGRRKNEKNVEKNVEHVMFTGFADKKTKSIVNRLGGQIVESPFTCTVLVTDKIRRTTKFLSAVSRGLPIVCPQWLIDSEENGKFMDFNNFILSDKETEKLFSFNLKKSIEKARNSKVLDGWSVYVTSSVKPSPEEMKSIIECSGGRYLSKEPARWPVNSLVISCNEDRAMWKNFSKRGKGPVVVENEALFLGVLRQELNLESFRLL